MYGLQIAGSGLEGFRFCEKMVYFLICKLLQSPTKNPTIKDISYIFIQNAELVV